ncbi:MAG TPA: TlpA disulfide reductase family protein [Candidatus Polarisedimenticolaceae bacterium]|nr:TlpA disulfide reductase family protein [Candidatus Polarisedimenticolaceae bacterium]
MRLALAAMALAATASLTYAQDRDEVRWIAAGKAGWTAAVGRELPPKTSPLLAPVNYAKVPDAKIPLAAGGVFDVASARGGVLIIDYWASWCTPCLQELPHLEKLFESRSAKGLTVLAINVDEDAATARASAKKIGLTMTIALNDNEFFRKLNVQQLSLPTTLVVDRQGRMRGRWNGYRTGDENDIAALVDTLLGADDKNPGRSIADVAAGAGRLSPLWSRDIRGSADGVLGLAPGLASGARAVASGGGTLSFYAADGTVTGTLPVPSWAGRLLAIDKDTRLVAAFRPGGQTIGTLQLPEGTAKEIAVDAPIVNAAAAGARVVVVTTAGASIADPAQASSTAVTGFEKARDVASSEGAALVLRADGSIASLEPAGAFSAKADEAPRLVFAHAGGVLVGPRTAVAAAAGKFLPGGGEQIALATYAGRLVLLDAKDGKILFDAVWPDLHDLASIDLDGDGKDELLVASGHSIAALAGH